jgi:plastocyanin
MKITGSLIVCSLAAAFTAGALIVDPNPAPRAPIAAPSDPGAPPQVSIQEYAFSAVTASPGATVAVVNADAEGHTVTSANDLFDSGVVDAGVPGSFIAPSAPGVYAFECLIHPTMVGQLTVTG